MSSDARDPRPTHLVIFELADKTREEYPYTEILEEYGWHRELREGVWLIVSQDEPVEISWELMRAYEDGDRIAIIPLEGPPLPDVKLHWNEGALYMDSEGNLWDGDVKSTDEGF